MDPRDNPYTPNAGARPPVLAGRDDEIQSFDLLLSRLARGRTEQSMIITGLRGVGKTVLLGEFRGMTEEAGWVAVEAEITRQTAFAQRMALLARRALLAVAPRAHWRERARRAAGVLRSFTLTVSADGAWTAGLDLDPVEGEGDSGLLAEDLTDVFVTLGEAARDHETGVVFLLDEMQFLAPEELEALIAALHKTVQRALPITLAGAGLPPIWPVEANEVFVALPTPAVERLRAAGASFYAWSAANLPKDVALARDAALVRLVTSFATTGAGALLAKSLASNFSNRSI
jgi:hypothetical protein